MQRFLDSRLRGGRRSGNDEKLREDDEELINHERPCTARTKAFVFCRIRAR